MITEQDLHEYNKWLMEVWNPNQLYIPFGIDAPKAYLTYKTKVKNLNIPRVINSRVAELEEENRLLKLIIENGLGAEDLENDCL